MITSKKYLPRIKQIHFLLFLNNLLLPYQNFKISLFSIRPQLPTRQQFFYAIKQLSATLANTNIAHFTLTPSFKRRIFVPVDSTSYCVYCNDYSYLHNTAIIAQKGFGIPKCLCSRTVLVKTGALERLAPLESGIVRSIGPLSMRAPGRDPR